MKLSFQLAYLLQVVFYATWLRFLQPGCIFDHIYNLQYLSNIVVVDVVLVPCIMFKFYFQDCESKVRQVAQTETKQNEKYPLGLLAGS